jgi:hypothetical protein
MNWRLLLVLLLAAPAFAAESEQSMHGKVFVGYQGWFAPVIEGTSARWIHFGDGGRFEPGRCVIDLWPDVSELGEDERVATSFKHADGRPAYVFSSANPKTVDRHFLWMKQYGIDGAFLQRFGASVASRQVSIHIDRVLENVAESAGRHGRLWSVMYDLSGLRPGQIRTVVMEDWRRLVVERKVRERAGYLRHRGKPIVTVWGIGFNDGRRYTLDECLELVRFLKSDPVAGGNTVMIGVPYYWRTLRNDTVREEKLHALIAEADVVSPWAVGRFGSPKDPPRLERDVIGPDVQWAREHSVDYLPVVFPGFSWHNLQKARGKETPTDQIPRRKGEFLWAQAAAARRAGADMLYVAMFDEIDEGTAIFKLGVDPPVGASPFVKLEPGVPPDQYLWLTGQIGRLLRGELKDDAMPRRETQP